MPHLTIRIDDTEIELAEASKTQPNAVKLVASHFDVPETFVACGLCAQEDFGVNRKTIEVTLAAAIDPGGVRKKAGDALADALLDYFVEWLNTIGRKGSASVSIQFTETNPYREGSN